MHGRINLTLCPHLVEEVRMGCPDNTLLYLIPKPYVCYTLMCHLHTVLDKAIRYSLYGIDYTVMISIELANLRRKVINFTLINILITPS